MHLIQILLPLRDAKGRGFPEAKYDAVAHELTDRFGGVTAYTRTPAEGRWKPGSEAATWRMSLCSRSVETLDAKGWKTYRKTLERSFRQKSIIVRAQDIQLL